MPIPLSTIPSVQELLIIVSPTSIPPLRGGHPLRQSTYNLTVCKDTILLPSPPKPCDMPSVQELLIIVPPTSIPPLRGGHPLRQYTYNLTVCKDTILLPSPPKPCDMPIHILNTMYQPSKVEYEPVDVDALKPDLNRDFEDNS